MANTEILAAIRALQTNFEVQLHANNKTIHDLHKSVDLWFDALQAGPLPARSGSPAEALAPASSPAFRSDGSSSVPQQRRGLHLLSFDITSAAASISIAAGTTSAAASTSIAAATTSAAASTSFSAAPPPFLSSDDTTTLYQTTSNADCVPTDPTAILAAPPAASSVNLTALLSVELFGKVPSPAPEPAPEVTPPPNFHLRPISPTPPPTAQSASPTPTKVALFPPPTTTFSSTQFHVLGHCTKVGQLLEINFWPSPSDMEAQSNPFNKYQDNAAVASRRGVIFSLYALEEVYKDILESPP